MEQTTSKKFIELPGLSVRSVSMAYMLHEYKYQTNTKYKEQWDKGYKEYNKAGERGKR